MDEQIIHTQFSDERYINPLTDFGFKRLFGSEPNKNLLIDFLNQLLPAHHKISDLSYSKNEQSGQTEMDRKAIYDLYCVSKTGERFIVELQKAKQNFFKDRSLYYASFPIQEQAKKGNWNFKLAAVYTIGILDFVFNDSSSKKIEISHVQLKDQNCDVFYDKLMFIYIELPKFTKKIQELTSLYEKWIYVFKHLSRLNQRPQELQEKVFKQLFETAEIAKFSPIERQAYEQSKKYYRDIKNVADTAKEEGKTEGRVEGRTERDIEIVTNCLKNGMTVDVISSITGLSIDKIQSIITILNKNN